MEARPADDSGQPAEASSAPLDRLTVTAIVVGAGGVLAVLFLLRDRSPAGVRAGDCITGVPQVVDSEFADAEVVDCDAPDASWRVVGVYTDRVRRDADTPCDGIDVADPPILVVYSAQPGERGDVVCVTSLSGP